MIQVFLLAWHRFRPPQTYTRQTLTKVAFIYCLCPVCVRLWLKKVFSPGPLNARDPEYGVGDPNYRARDSDYRAGDPGSHHKLSRTPVEPLSTAGNLQPSFSKNLKKPWCTLVPSCLGGTFSLFGSGSSGSGA